MMCYNHNDYFVDIENSRSVNIHACMYNVIMYTTVVQPTTSHKLAMSQV